MAGMGEPKKRFAPIPIETTFESIRQNAPTSVPQVQPGGYMPELTPEPSPRELSPAPLPGAPSHEEGRPKRRFAPQLIETSRRARRMGDTGPATRPTDKTDITPYTNHIYVQRNKSRRRQADKSSSHVLQQPKGARRESEDENAGDYVLEWAAMEAERQMQEDALAAFPNSRAREGGAAHFYFRESSGDESTSTSTSPSVPDEAPSHPNRQGRHGRVARRKSSDLGYWHKYMQEHAEKVAHEREETDAGQNNRKRDSLQDGGAGIEIDDAELDKMELEGPPDPLWLTTNRKPSIVSLSDAKGPIGETCMPLITSDTRVGKEARLAEAILPTGAPKPIGESHMPLIPSAPPNTRAAGTPLPASSQIPPETGFRNAGTGFGRPYGMAAPGREDGHPRKLKTNAASPPLLGKDLVFRRCPSPKFTKLEPDYPFKDLGVAEEANRDTSGDGGLWKGYCFKGRGDECDIVPPTLHGPKMITTPHPPSSPGDPFAQAFGRKSITDEPDSMIQSPGFADRRPRSGEAKGLHMLHGLGEKLRREKAVADREDKIAAEFDDAFITQVYNYLSLGYPAMARAYDEELAKISRMSIDDLEKEDSKQMATGHFVEAPMDDVPEEQRCPRWKGLKSYIIEWARQHPDLDSLDPLAWGVRERRGSWAV